MENVTTNAPKNLSRKQKPNTNPTNQYNQPKNNQQDSKTNVDKRRIRFSDKLTVRCDPETKKAFLSFCEQTGLTECQILHALLTAYLTGMTQKIEVVDKSPTINLHIERVVARPRRILREEFGDVGGDEGGGFVWFYDLDGGVWRRVRVEDGFDVNVNGHFVGCGCHVCNPKAAVKG